MINAKWGVSENNRKARFYTLTAKGRAQLNAKTSQWNRLKTAMESILSPAGEEA
jgi:DNA-binding PadR family transcriptional regulator